MASQTQLSDLEKSSATPTQLGPNFGTEKVNYEVVLEASDPENVEKQMPLLRKWFVAMLVTFTSADITMTSSCWSLAQDDIRRRFGISEEVSILGLSLYLWGMGTGPLLLSPLSELYGRKPTFVWSLALSTCFLFLTTWGTNITALLIGRYLSGFFGSSFLSVAGGVISDMFSKEQIGVPMTIYTTATFLGPALGPLISGALSGVSYRWTFIVMIIESVIFLGLLTVAFQETYQPVLLLRKAERLRRETGDDRYYAPLEVERREISFRNAITISAGRPFGLLTRDPMMGVLCFYTGLVLAIIYMFFLAFPLVFTTLYNFTKVEVGVSYMGLLVGIFMAAPTSLWFQKRYQQRVSRNNGVSVPEFRFEPLFYGAFLSPMGLMIFAWTSYSHVHWIAPIIGTGVFGAGVFFVFAGVFGYTVDAFRLYTASAMACNSFVRSVMGGVFPLFTLQMYRGMGINWASFLLAMVAMLMIPVPFLFTRYGASLRSKSPYAWD
ncbi:LANO_0H10044g1_1 [Lachancea nothofagi CBS 11611]|uniref:LANO_0H10044g1_1 n=1 Tax=Lachancea nothofagi CBS 11611 TaxID=1266666 RepID=A0A1G4KM53_9SACH|nr:LANO_0H10044g1_1 [Lachancea nothofagi CBS 11611]